jgi:hypothetical protein
MFLPPRQSLQNKQCFHNLYAYLSAARNTAEVVLHDILHPPAHYQDAGSRSTKNFTLALR